MKTQSVKHYDSLKLTFRELFWGVFFALYGLAVSEYLSLYPVVGKLTSFLVFGYCILQFYLKTYQRASNLFLLFLFSTPFLPRDLSIISGQSMFVFESLVSTKVGPLTLSAWLIILLAFMAFLKIRFNFLKRNKPFSIFIIVLILGMSLSTILDVFIFRKAFRLNYFINDLRFFVFFISGIIAGCYYFSFAYKRELFYKELFRVFTILTIAFGLKTIIIIYIDLVQGNLFFNFGTQPYLFIPIFFALLISNIAANPLHKLTLIILAFLGAFSISRGNIAFMGFCFILYLLLVNNKGDKWRKSSLIILIPLFLFGVWIVAESVLNDKVFSFLTYKVEFFSKELTKISGSGIGGLNTSGAIRVYEYQNIVAEMKELSYPFYFGKGFGSYFEYNHIPSPFLLNNSDYLQEQLDLKEYYRPHTFLNYSLLKGGFVFLSFFVFSTLFFIFRSIKMMKRNQLKYEYFFYAFTLFFGAFVLQVFWIPEFVFFWGLLSSGLTTVK